MRLFTLALLLCLSLVAEAGAGAKPKTKKYPNLAPRTYPAVGQCRTSCDTLASRVTFVDEGLEHCGLDGDYFCPAQVGEYCTASATKKCVLMEKGYCTARCGLDGKQVTYDEHCAEGYVCVKKVKCTHALRDRTFERVSCR